MKKNLLGIAACLFYCCASAQDAPFQKITPVSPQSAILSKFQEIPVGNYTGIPQTNIPIYTIQSKEITIPISLDYHGGGIKVSEVASNVGLGWALTAGGAIVQQVRGIPDQGLGGFLTRPDIIRDFATYGVGEQGEVAERILKKSELDSEADIFFYNFNGKSGKLFFDADGHTVHTIPRTKIKATYFPGLVSKWEIIAEDGFKYIFAVEETSESITAGVPTSNKSSTWYLSEIVSPNGTDTVVFGYRGETYSFTNVASAVAYAGPSANLEGPSNGGCPYPGQSVSKSSTRTAGAVLSTITFSGGKVKFIPSTEERLDLNGAHAISSIEVYDINNSLNKKVNLSYSYGSSPTSKRLYLDQVTNVDLTNNGGDHAYTFGYSFKDRLPEYDSFSQDHWGYFNGAANVTTGFVPTTLLNYNGTADQYYNFPGADRNPSGLALAGTLTSIKLPTGGTEEFEYEPNTISGRKINLTPLKYSGGASIHAEFDEDLQPKMQYELYFDIKENNTKVEYTFKNGPAFGQGAPGPLGRIFGPDGSQITMSYAETNKATTLEKKGKYRFFVDFTPWPEYVEKFKFNIMFLAPLGVVTVDSTQQNEIVGGLRIKRIVVKDPLSQSTLIKKYIYTDYNRPNLSSGTLVTKPKYVEYVDINTEMSLSCLFLRISSYSGLPLSTTGGAYVGYSHVTELLGENGENGKNEYFYTSPNGTPDKVGYKPYRVTSREHHRGKLTSEVNYKFENNQFIKIRSLNNSYADVGLQTYPNLKFGGDVPAEDHNIPFNGRIKANYEVYDTETDYYNLISQTTTLYNNDPAQTITSVKDYTYNDNNQLASERSSDSRGPAVINTAVYSYPPDMVAKGITSPYQEMVNRNMLSTVIEEEKQLNNAPLEKKITLYANNLAPGNQLILPSEIQTKYKNEAAETRWRYHRYDAKGNPLSVSKEKGVKTNYVWAYNGLYPVAEIKGVDYSVVESTLGTSAIQNLINSNPDKNAVDQLFAPLKTQLPEAFISTYIFKPLLGMTSQTDPKGMTTYYEYDEFQRLKNVKDQEGNIIKNTSYHYKP
jgi:hypothetical protein